VESDSLHHPRIFIEDTSAKTKRLLIRGSRPRWSPDGKRIACQVWRSKERPWMLCVVELASGREVEPRIGCFAMNYSWSPNAQYLAIEGPLFGGTRRGLCRVEFPSLDVVMLDTLPVMSNYHVTWSPDSRYLVTDRATSLDRYEDVTASDLWLFDEHLRRCRLTSTTAIVESEPKWIDATRIQFTRELLREEELGDEEVRILELTSPGRRAAKGKGPS
jgi:dipeptidyl aminopeptidase/acylaminoacyl peptidase